MIFIANALPVNGGTTFLIRLTRELQSRGERCAVLLLRNDMDQALATELGKTAVIIRLSEFLPERGRFFRAHLGTFAPVRWARLQAALQPFGNHVHAMSVLGLSFALRMNKRVAGIRISVGVYHQNEFLFDYPPFLLAREALRKFSALPLSNLVFFNESVQENYARFFGDAGYKEALLVPIGIELPTAPKLPPSEPSFRIVSIGNLLGFKTYNRHMINIVARLRNEFPDIRYDIYGAGPEEASLRKLVRQHGLEAHVHLNGTIPYDYFPRALEKADLFVGSGTALVEAAALGVPALVGIESIETPDSYGFLCDIKGCSYNENMSELPARPMIGYVRRILSDHSYRDVVAQRCAARAQDFSVSRTADGFNKLETQAVPVAAHIDNFRSYRLMLSMLSIGLGERMRLVRSFSDRRNQSY